MEKKILVVDDSLMIRQMIHAAFVKHGYRVRMADTSKVAMDVLKKESIMVMFLDLQLPGMSGIDLCKKIRKEGYIGFVYAITGSVDVYGLMQCRSAGFDDYFTKPFSLNVIMKAANEAFEKIERWQDEAYLFV